MLFLFLSFCVMGGIEARHLSSTYKDLPIIFRNWSDIYIPSFSRIIDDPNFDLLIRLFISEHMIKPYEHSLIPS